MDNEQFVIELERSVWDAVVRKDGDALSDLFSDDYVEVTLDGIRFEKSAVVQESPLIDVIENYSIDSTKVIFVTSDVAVLSYHLTLVGTTRGEPIIPSDRWASSVWSRREDTWKCCLFQQSTFKNREKEKA